MLTRLHGKAQSSSIRILKLPEHDVHNYAGITHSLNGDRKYLKNAVDSMSGMKGTITVKLKVSF